MSSLDMVWRYLRHSLETTSFPFILSQLPLGNLKRGAVKIGLLFVVFQTERRNFEYLQFLTLETTVANENDKRSVRLKI